MIFMAAPGYAANMVFAGAPSGDVYQSNQFGLIYVGSGGAPDQLFLQGAGCATLTPFSGYPLPSQTGWKLASTRCMPPGARTGVTNGKLMSGIVHYATTALSGLIRLTLPGWQMTQNIGDEWGFDGTSTSGAMTVSGAIYYPTTAPSDMIGSYSGLQVPAGGDGIVFIGLTKTIPAGAKYFEACYATPASGNQVFTIRSSYNNQSQGPSPNTNYGLNIPLGEGAACTTGQTDQTLALASFLASSANDVGSYGASSICSVQTLSQSVVAVWGDSLEAGYYGGGDQYNNLGASSWAFGDTTPALLLGSPGDAAENQVLAGFSGTGYPLAVTMRMALLKYAGVTHVIVALGTNDVTGGVTLANIKLDLTYLYNLLAAQGYVVIGATVPPNTTSTDSWATVGNQTVTANESNRTGLNTWIRSLPAPLAGFTERCTPVESTPGSGKWSAPGGTVDGIHWYYANALLVAAQVPLADFATVPSYVDTYGQGAKSTQAAIDLVMGREAAPGVTKLTTDANHSYAPYAEGRQFHDTAALTADRKLVLITASASGVAIPDGHTVHVSRHGSSGGHNRAVYQADGTTLIANVADSATSAFTWSAVDVLWYQS